MASFTNVAELYCLCKKEMDKGNGSKIIMISQDDEGNGYHYLFYGFSEAKDILDDYTNSDFNEEVADIENTIILG